MAGSGLEQDTHTEEFQSLVQSSRQRLVEVGLVGIEPSGTNTGNAQVREPRIRLDQHPQPGQATTWP